MSGETLQRDDDVREIMNVGMLDFSSFKSEEELKKIGKIHNIGVVIVPENLMAAAMQIQAMNVGAYVAVPSGSKVVTRSGDISLSGDALENPGGGEGDVLVLMGDIIISSPVKQVGYKSLIIMGSLLAPREGEAVLSSAISSLMGDCVYYDGRIGADTRLFSSDTTLSGAFFDFIDAPIHLLVTGKLTLAGDVSTTVLKQKVSGISLTGRLQAENADLVPLLQFLTLENRGEISVLDSRK